MGKIGHFGLLSQALPAASLQEPLPTSGLSSRRQGLHRRLHPSLKVSMSEPVLASLCSHLPESSLPQPNRVPFKTTCHRLFKKIQLFIVLDANIVLKLHCSVEYSWWKRASQQWSMRGGVLDGTGLREPLINKALLWFCFSDHERKLPPNGALTQSPELTTEKTSQVNNKPKPGREHGGSAWCYKVSR